MRQGCAPLRIRTRERRGTSVASILIVEDDPELRRIVGYALMDEGIACIETANGREVIQTLCQCTADGRFPDCVVLDIFMPGGIDGWRVLESMRATRCGPTCA